MSHQDRRDPLPPTYAFPTAADLLGAHDRQIRVQMSLTASHGELLAQLAARLTALECQALDNCLDG